MALTRADWRWCEEVVRKAGVRGAGRSEGWGGWSPMAGKAPLTPPHSTHESERRPDRGEKCCSYMLLHPGLALPSTCLQGMDGTKILNSAPGFKAALRADEGLTVPG